MRFQCPFCRGIVSAMNDEMGMEVRCGHCDEIVVVPSERLASRSVIADFVIIEELGRGGVGVVYLSHQLSLDRPAALKVLSDAYAKDAEFVKDFIKEARAAAKLNHPHIAQAYAVGEDDGIFYFASEFINGKTTKEILKEEGTISVSKAVTIIQQCAEALDYAWKEQKLIHRDIKPDNLMLTKSGQAKLIDLGLARMEGDLEDGDEDEIMGTPQYISPEHLTGAPMDVRSDIYSLGATFYHFVTGRFPFEGRSATEIVRKHLEEPLVPPQKVNPAVPEAVGQIICRMMEKDINKRYQNAEDLADDLRAYRRGKTPPRVSVSSPTFGTQTQSAITDHMPRWNAELGNGRLTPPKHTTTSSGLIPLYTATNSSTGLDFDLTSDDGLRRKGRGVLVTLIIVMALIALGGAFWLFRDRIPGAGKIIKDIGGGAKVATVKDVKQTPVKVEKSEYCKKLDKLLLSFSENPDKVDDFMDSANMFFADNPQPVSEQEMATLKSFIIVYSEIDEKRNASKRQALEEKRRELIKKIKIEDAKRIAAEKKRKAEEARKLAERKKREAKRRAAELAARRKLEKERQRAAEYKKKLDARSEKLRIEFIEYILDEKYEKLEKLLEQELEETSKAGDLSSSEKKVAADYVKWVKMLQGAFKEGQRVSKLINDSGSKFKGLTVELGGGMLVKINKISNGTIYGHDPSDSSREYEKKVSQVSMLLLGKMLEKGLKIEDASEMLSMYHLYTGQLNYLVPKKSGEWQDESRKLLLAYFKKVLSGASRSEIRKLIGEYRHNPQFAEAFKDVIKKK